LTTYELQKAFLAPLCPAAKLRLSDALPPGLRLRSDVVHFAVALPRLEGLATGLAIAMFCVATPTDRIPQSRFKRSQSREPCVCIAYFGPEVCLASGQSG